MHNPSMTCLTEVLLRHRRIGNQIYEIIIFNNPSVTCLTHAQSFCDVSDRSVGMSQKDCACTVTGFMKLLFLTVSIL